MGRGGHGLLGLVPGPGHALVPHRPRGPGDTGATVTFPDGRVLCHLDLRSGTARDEHACSPDTYRVHFTVTAYGTVDYSWDVTGPAKDHLLTTVLTRTGAPSAPSTDGPGAPTPQDAA